MKIDKYSLHFIFNGSNNEYSCTEKIEITNPPEILTLNCVNIKVEYIKQRDEFLHFTVNEGDESLSVKVERHRKIILFSKFTGKINEAPIGIYRVKTKDGYMLTTQLEPSGARRLFLCMDHPAYKSIFEISVTVKNELDAVSNTRIEEVVNSNESKLIKFKPTPKMSTYLVYIGIGKIKHFGTVKENHIEIILKGPEGSISDQNLPLSIAKKALGYYENYFGIALPLEKIDLISVPHSEGAMENWGAIKFSENVINISNSSSAAEIKRGAIVIAHELAHQWFGDLVTMKWWNDLWLNESFATFMAYKSLNSIYPELNFDAEFLVDRYSKATWIDSISSIHSVNHMVENPNEVVNLAREIRYDKGAALLRMFEDFIGEEPFRRGIRKYLKENMYGNATGNDLWSCLEESLDIEVKKIVGPWIRKPGLPIVSYKLAKDSVLFEQNRFLLKDDKKSSNSIWPIPIKVRFEEGEHLILLRKKRLRFKGENIISINKGFTGYYKIKYDEEFLEKIFARKSIDENELIGVFNNLFSMLLSNIINIGEYTKYLEKIKEHLTSNVIREITDQLSLLYLIDSENPDLLKFETNYILDLMRIYSHFSKEQDLNSLLAWKNLSEMRLHLDPSYADKFSGKFYHYADLDQNERYVSAIAFAKSVGSLSELTDSLKHSINVQEYENIISAMGWITNEGNLLKIIDLFKHGTISKSYLIFFLLTASKNPAIKDFFADNFASLIRLCEDLEISVREITRLVESSLPFVLLRTKEPEKVLKDLLKCSGTYTSQKTRATEFYEIYNKFKITISANSVSR
jgi:tricorn protease interacting factor F2/3